MLRGRAILAFGLAALLIFSAVSVFAKDHRSHRFLPRALLDKLELTDAQKTRIKKITLDAQKEEIAKQADLRIARLELRAMMEELKPDRTKIRSQIKKISNLRSEVQIISVNQRLDIKEQLTPEQIKKFQDLRKERSKHFRGEGPRHRKGLCRGWGRHGPPGEPGPPPFPSPSPER